MALLITSSCAQGQCLLGSTTERESRGINASIFFLYGSFGHACWTHHVTWLRRSRGRHMALPCKGMQTERTPFEGSKVTPVLGSLIKQRVHHRIRDDFLPHIWRQGSGKPSLSREPVSCPFEVRIKTDKYTFQGICLKGLDFSNQSSPVNVMFNSAKTLNDP